MPKIKTKRAKPPPEGWETIENALEAFQESMREAEVEPHHGKRKNESLFRVLRIARERTRFVYEQFYLHKAISRKVYDYCLENKYADPLLIAKWKKQGYEKLCCLRCIQPQETQSGSVCICRVPDVDDIECALCGCSGCASNRKREEHSE